MTEPRPRIAIPQPTSAEPDYNARSLPQYAEAIQAAGGDAVTIALDAPVETQAALLATCAGILLPGSPADVNPVRYGQDRIPACAAPDAAREAVDQLLLETASATGRPLLGICFGLQSLNVWKQGSLIQDLPKASEETPTVVNHAPGRTVLEAHAVEIEAGSRLAACLSGEAEPAADRSVTMLVNSSHHQAVDRPGSGLRVAARSTADGVVEALETVEPNRFLVGVQWHPERSYTHSEASRALFRSFLEAAKQWAAANHA